MKVKEKNVDAIFETIVDSRDPYTQAQLLISLQALAKVLGTVSAINYSLLLRSIFRLKTLICPLAATRYILSTTSASIVRRSEKDFQEMSQRKLRRDGGY